MSIYYSATTNAFYDTTIINEGSIPADKVEITAEEYASLIEAQNNGYLIVAGEGGKPTTLKQNCNKCNKLNHDYVVETWRSEDGVNWYRKWSDGWIEQGGYSWVNGDKDITVTLPITFSDMNYTVIATNRSGFHVGNDAGVAAIPKAANQITLLNGVTSGVNITWYACGY